MATFKTPEELRAWSRSFLNKSQIIKRGFYNYIDPEEEKRKEEEKENLAGAEADAVSKTDASSLASSIIAKGNASSANISELFSLDSSVIDDMNSKFPTTEEQLMHTKGVSPVTKK